MYTRSSSPSDWILSSVQSDRGREHRGLRDGDPEMKNTEKDEWSERLMGKRIEGGYWVNIKGIC